MRCNLNALKILHAIFNSRVLCLYFQSFPRALFSPDSTERNPITLSLKGIYFSNIAKKDIAALNERWFTVSERVLSLHLDNLEVSLIGPYAFNTKHFETLKELTITSKITHYIFSNAFNGLENLVSLSLYDMKITGFASETLAPLQSLEKFSMQRCNARHKKFLLSIDRLFATNLPNLERIEISRCNLSTTITNSTFVGLQNISFLNLTENHIEQLGQGSFDSIFRTLKTLNLAANDLKSIPKQIFSKAKGTGIKIFLQDNPWHCDCDLENFRRFLQFSQNIDPQQIICKTPKNLAGKQLYVIPSLCSGALTPPENAIIHNGDSHKHFSSFNDEDSLKLFDESQQKPSSEATNHHAINRDDSHEIHNYMPTDSHIVNLTVVVYVPKETTNDSVIQLFLVVHSIYLLFFHLGWFFFWI